MLDATDMVYVHHSSAQELLQGEFLEPAYLTDIAPLEDKQ